MYYKIENKNCELYKKLHEMRSNELRMEIENKDAIKEKTGLEWIAIIGKYGQQNWNRVTVYQGFEFKDKSKVDPKIWKPSNRFPECHVPNTRTKVGREMADFLGSGLKGFAFTKALRILGLHTTGRFQFPFIEISDDLIIMCLDKQHQPEDHNVIEITSVEFNNVLNQVKEKAA